MFITEKEDGHEKRFTEEQIIRILKEAEAGLLIKELCQKHNISDVTFYTPGTKNMAVWKCLAIVDDFSKESLDIPVANGISGEQVARTLDTIATFRGYPVTVRTDQRTEFTGKALDQWAYHHDVELKLMQLGNPMQNGYIESFNGKCRDECLNEHWFTALAAHVRELINQWQIDYDENRPHSSLGYQTPLEFAAVTDSRKLIHKSGALLS